jgi:tRNA A-37 threonylcarbamoyl transferase component Bud32
MQQSLAPVSPMGPIPHHPAEDEGLAVVRDKILAPDPEFRRLYNAEPEADLSRLQDYLLAAGEQPHDPEHAFGRLRWGGQFVYSSADRNEVARLAQHLAERGFALTHGPAFVRTGWGIPLISPKRHYVAARKTLLIPPREFSDRFTYQVQLERREPAQRDGSPDLGTDCWVVRKEIPTLDRVLARLQFKAPDVPVATLERRAKKFVEQIFPLFLTREAAMLKVIERDCPAEFRHRFPRVVEVQKDSKGYVQRLWTTWLRNSGKPITQIEFARQSAELLHLLHDRIGIIHLDLRMDNMVISNGAVGFVDFGSAVRVNENIHGNAVLSTLFGELMRTSQIQRMMDRMATAGSLTSAVIREAHQRVDKAVDVFYLAVQISQPTANPDLHDLVKYDKYSPEAVELARLTNDILRPADPAHPRYRTALDVLQELRRIEMKLKSGTAPRVVITAAGPEPARPAPKAPAPAQPPLTPQPHVMKQPSPPSPPSKPKVYIWES